MSYRDQINTILNQKMDRQSFLKQSLLAIVALFGFGTVLRILQQNQEKPVASIGYGSSSYGGSKDGRS